MIMKWSETFTLFGMRFTNIQTQNFILTLYHRITTFIFKKKMITYITLHYYDNIDLEDIAASGNISRSKCCQIFKKYMQQSPVAYLNAYRMELSCNLLKTTSYSITSIATSCGYNHLSYFSRIFLKKFGCTPMEYRKKFQSC